MGWWLPGAIVGGLALGAVPAVTAPIRALSAPVYPPAVAYPPLVAYAAPRVVYSAPASTAYPAPPPTPVAPPAVRREVVYPNGRDVLHGDGVSQPWRWVWIPAASPPPAPPQR